MNVRVVLAVVILVLLATVVLLAMVRSWRTGQARSAAVLPPLPQVPAVLGAARTEPFEGIYVTSTTAGDRLARVHGYGLGARSAAQVQVHDAGVLITRQGASDVFVPADDVLGVERASGIAGKAVGGDRLVVLRWRLTGGSAPDETVLDKKAPDETVPEETVLDTGLHLRHPVERDALTDALRALAATHAGPDRGTAPSRDAVGRDNEESA